MTRNEWRTLGRALLAALDAALPFEHGPAVKSVLRQFRKDRFEVDLAVARGTESSCTVRPRLISTINTLPPRRTELRILHMKHFYAIVIEVDEFQIIKLLQNKMARIEQNVASFMILHALQEHFKTNSIVQILTGMNFITKIHSRSVKRIQNRHPSRRKIIERSLDKPWRALRPWIHIRPSQRARKRHMGLHSQIRRRLRGPQ